MASSAEQTRAYFAPEQKAKLIADGSKKDGIKCILTQLDPKIDRYRPVRYDNRTLKDTGTSYLQIEVENLVKMVEITKSYIYLYGLTHFEVVEHLPYATLKQKTDEHTINISMVMRDLPTAVTLKQFEKPPNMTTRYS